MEYVIHTDGSHARTPFNMGGWAYLIGTTDKSFASVASGAWPRTTSVKMELMAVVEALKNVPKGGKATVWTDSHNVVEEARRDIVADPPKQRQSHMTGHWQNLRDMSAVRDISWKLIRRRSNDEARLVDNMAGNARRRAIRIVETILYAKRMDMYFDFKPGFRERLDEEQRWIAKLVEDVILAGGHLTKVKTAASIGSEIEDGGSEPCRTPH